MALSSFVIKFKPKLNRIKLTRQPSQFLCPSGSIYGPFSIIIMKSIPVEFHFRICNRNIVRLFHEPFTMTENVCNLSC